MVVVSDTIGQVQKRSSFRTQVVSKVLKCRSGRHFGHNWSPKCWSTKVVAISDAIGLQSAKIQKMYPYPSQYFSKVLKYKSGSTKVVAISDAMSLQSVKVQKVIISDTIDLQSVKVRKLSSFRIPVSFRLLLIKTLLCRRRLILRGSAGRAEPFKSAAPVSQSGVPEACRIFTLPGDAPKLLFANPQ